MSDTSVKSICGVIIAAADPKALAAFYSQVFQVEFEEEDHGGLDIHYGIDIGTVHLGIHPPGNLGRDGSGNGSVSVAYNVDNFNEVIDRLGKLQARQATAPHDEGFGMVATFLDPEDNPFEVVELNYQFDKD